MPANEELAAQYAELKASQDSLKNGLSGGKNRLDWFGAWTTFGSSVIVGLLGAYVTFSYNNQQTQARQQETKLAQERYNQEKERDRQRYDQEKARDAVRYQQELELKKLELGQRFLPTNLKDVDKGKILSLLLQDTRFAPIFAYAALGATKAAENNAASPDAVQKAEKALADNPIFTTMPSAGLGGSKIGRQALQAAIGELRAGAREQGGNNRGPFVRKYLAAVKLEEGLPWSTAFVSWCFSTTQGELPFKLSASGPNIAKEFKEKGWYHPGGGDYRPVPGDILWKMQKDGRITGSGIVIRTTENTVYTIEGNTNEGPGSKDLDSNRVAGRARPNNALLAFGHVPD